MKLMLRLAAGPALALGLVCTFAAPARAAAILIGQTIHVELLDNGILPDPLPEDILVVAGQQEITWNNTPFVTNIGSSGLMFDGEFIDIGALSITFSLFGGGDPHSPGYRVTGFGSDARYVFSNLFSLGDAEIIDVVPVTPGDNVVLLDTDVLFDTHSVTLRIGTLGIRESASNLGLVQLNLLIREIVPVPEPATVVLVGGGAIALLARRRRR